MFQPLNPFTSEGTVDQFLFEGKLIQSQSYLTFSSFTVRLKARFKDSFVLPTLPWGFCCIRLFPKECYFWTQRLVSLTRENSLVNYLSPKTLNLLRCTSKDHIKTYHPKYFTVRNCVFLVTTKRRFYEDRNFNIKVPINCKMDCV